MFWACIALGLSAKSFVLIVEKEIVLVIKYGDATIENRYAILKETEVKLRQ